MTTVKERSNQRLKIRHELKKSSPKGASLTSKVTAVVKKRQTEKKIEKKNKELKKIQKKAKNATSSKDKFNAKLIERRLAKATDIKAVTKNLKKKYGEEIVSLVNKKLAKIAKENDAKRAKKGSGKIIPGSDYKARDYYNYAGIKYVGQEGAFKIPGSEFAGWYTPEAGRQAVFNQIEKDKRRNLDIRQFVTKYAPPSENDTEKYIQQLSQAVGADENTNIATLDTNIIASFLAKKESQTDLGIDSGYGGGGGASLSDEGATYATNYPGEVYTPGSDPSGEPSPVGNTVAYKSSGGTYYSVNTATGQKTKVTKAEAKSLDKIDEKEYKELKKSLNNMGNTSSGGKANALNRDQLAALKAVRPDVAAHKTYGKDAKGLLAWWDKYGKNDANLLNQINDYVGRTGGSTASNLTNVSYDLQNDPSYQALPDDLKKMAAYFENVGLASNTEQGTKLINALQTAAEQSNAYYKQFFRIAEDTIIQGNAAIQAAYGNQSDYWNKRITELQEDLAKNKEFLTLEEQSDLTRISNEYKANLQATQGTMAAAGLTQSTIRSEAEMRLAEQNKGLVEDTQRQYGKKIAELETAASRGSEEAKTELDKLKTSLGFNVSQLGRELESQVGSANMPSLAGYTPLGNITGSLVENKTSDIFQRAGTLLGESNMSSLNLNL